MPRDTYFKFAMILSGTGAMYSGTLSVVRFTTQQCLGDQECPMFLGAPACYFGFGGFVILFALSLWGAVTKPLGKGLPVANVSLSALGMAFASYFVVRAYPAAASSCFYGAVFFALVFAISLMRLRGRVTVRPH